MKKIIQVNNLNALVKHIQSQNKKIVFTNGCFDLLHQGHLHLLKAAKKLGDILIVAINSDNSIKRLKGNNRPIETLSIRIEKLSQLDDVDFIIAFDTDTPLELIQQIEPNILVKGSDYKDKIIVGSDIIEKNKGKVVLVDILEGYSTTNQINKINQQ